MARILGFQYGEMRGKLGGNVFSRNKAGAYVRAKVTPVNPQTVRQQNARYRFGNMSILFQSLSTMQKNCWESFAKSHFNPLKGNNTGIYSAGNAFVALRQSAGQGNEYRVAPTMEADGSAVTVTSQYYNEALDPPSAPSSATLKSDQDNVYNMSVSDIRIGEDGTYRLNVDIPVIDPTSVDTISGFRNAEDQTYGLSIYISNVLKFEGSKPNTALKLNFADTGVIETLAVGGNDVPIADQLILRGVTGLDPATVRDFPCIDDVVLASVFLRTREGAQKMIKTQYVTVLETVPAL